MGQELGGALDIGRRGRGYPEQIARGEVLVVAWWVGDLCCVHFLHSLCVHSILFMRLL